jgi:gamma-glutamyl hydrolase
MPYIVGILTIPYDLSYSYISYEHIQLLNHYKLQIYPIPYNTTDYKYYFDRIHGLYIPSGIITKGKIIVTDRSNQFLNTCYEFIKLAIKSYNNNIPFPIWGTCLGMESIIQAIDKNISLTRFNAYPNYTLRFNPTKSGMLYSNIIKNMDEETLNDWMKYPIEIHNHGKGISINKFNKSTLLTNMFNIISIGDDKEGHTFVSLIEGKKYPFYGVQWHPELSKKTYSILISYVNDIKNSKKKILNDRKTIKSFIDNKICNNYSDGLYKKCLFFITLTT